MIVWFKSATALAKTVTLFISLSVGIAGGIAVYNNWIVGRHEQGQQLEVQSKEFRELQESFDVVIDSIGSLSKQIRIVESKVENVNTKANFLMESDNNLKNFMLEHAVSTEEVLNIIEIWDIKKKENGNLGEIVSGK